MRLKPLLGLLLLFAACDVPPSAQEEAARSARFAWGPPDVDDGIRPAYTLVDERNDDSVQSVDDQGQLLDQCSEECDGDVKDEECTCDYRTQCIDFYVVGSPSKDGKKLSFGKNWIKNGATVSKPDDGGQSFIDLAKLGKTVSGISDKLDALLKAINKLYADCCVEFKKGTVYVIDPRDAGAFPDPNQAKESKLSSLISPKVNSAHDVQSWFRDYVARHNGDKKGECLQMLMVPGLAKTGKGGVGQTPGKYAIVDEDIALTGKPEGAVPAHEIGHNLGLDDLKGDSNKGNVMYETDADRDKVKFDAEQCKAMKKELPTHKKGECPKPR